MILWSLVPNVGRAEALARKIDASGRPLIPEGDAQLSGQANFSHYQPHLYPLDHRRAVLSAASPLRLDLPADWPDMDYVADGPDLVSRRLRDVLALGEDEVFYGAVDIPDPPPVARLADYKRLALLQWGDPIDRRHTAGRNLHVLGPGGAWVTEWRPNLGFGPDARPNPISWRSGFRPPAPAFHIPGLPSIFVTDDLADRVMQAGITDVEFMDISGVQTPGMMRLRR